MMKVVILQFATQMTQPNDLVTYWDRFIDMLQSDSLDDYDTF